MWCGLNWRHKDVRSLQVPCREVPTISHVQYQSGQVKPQCIQHKTLADQEKFLLCFVLSKSAGIVVVNSTVQVDRRLGTARKKDCMSLLPKAEVDQ
eukprot:SM000135S27047  [mRNA]  locus=s135:398444:398990:- [translate_table: standard]